MAVKKGKTGAIGFLAFVAIILIVVAYVFLFLENICHLTLSINGHSIPSILNWVASIFTTIVIAACSYDFAMKQGKFWRVLWWVLAIIAVCAVIGIGGFNIFSLAK